MLAYAPDRRTNSAFNRSPQTLMWVVVGHVALVAVALTTKMTIDYYHPQDPTEITNIRLPPPPPDPKPVEQVRPQEPAQQSHIDRVVPVLPVKPVDDGIDTQPGPSLPSGPVAGNNPNPGPTTVIDPIQPAPVRIAARFNTPDSALRPPYPNDKLRAEEETTLRLRLTIDARGRVTAVEPVGRADPSFLESARRHIIRSWRYRPATVDGVATGSTTVISLSFRLEDA